MSQKKFGAKVRELREQRGLTQAQLAHGIVSAAYVSLIEAGAREPSPRVARALLTRLGVDDEGEAHDRDLLLKVCAATDVGDTTAALELLGDPQEQPAAPSPRRRLAKALVDQRLGFYRDAQHEFLRLVDLFDPGSIEHLRCVRGACACARFTGAVERVLHAARTALEAPAAVETAEHLQLKSTIRASAATLYSLTGDHESALELCRIAIEQARSPWALASAMWVQAMTHESDGRPDLAVMCARESLTHMRESDRPIERAQILNTLSWLEMQAGQFDETVIEQRLDEAQEVYRERGHTDSLALALSTRAELVARTRGLAEAAPMFEAAVQGFSPEQHMYRGRVLTILGRFHAEAGDTSAAVSALDRALNSLENSEYLPQTARAWHELGQTYEAAGHTHEAMFCFKRANELLGLRSASAAVPSARSE